MIVPALEIGALDPAGITEIENETSVPVRTSVGTENVTSQSPTTSYDSCAETKGTPAPARPTTTVPCGATIAPGAATPFVATSGFVTPRPVAKAIRFSPRRA